MPFDLDAYFNRIGYGGSAAPTLETLNAIVEAHVSTIPFENLDVLLDRGISLAPDAIVDKLVRRKRGGYCFEQNGLLLMVLLAMGYDVRPISARVRYQRPRDFTPPRTHLFLRLELEGESRLADVGVGGLSLTSSLRLVTDIAQPTPHETRRLVRENGRWFHQAKLGEDWADVCEFTLEEMPPIDRELANWFTSTHPESAFKHRLTVARALPNGERLTILNRELTRRRRDGSGETRLVESPSDLLDILSRDFNLSFPEGTLFPCPAVIW